MSPCPLEWSSWLCLLKIHCLGVGDGGVSLCTLGWPGTQALCRLAMSSERSSCFYLWVLGLKNSTNLGLKFSKNFWKFGLCVCVSVCLSFCACYCVYHGICVTALRRQLGDWFSSTTTTWVLGIEFKLRCLAASVFTHWVTSPALLLPPED